MSANELTLTAPPNGSEPQGMVGMMERLALNPDLPVEKLEKLLEMQLRIRAIEAETAFNAAMSESQSEMKRISADAINPQTSSKYASYGQLDRHLRPIYTKHGFAVSFDEGVPPTPDVVLALAYVSHSGGHTRTYRKTMPIVTTGIKGNVMMTATHGSASAGSYAKRYLLKDIFNIAIGEDDDDGNAAGGEVASIEPKRMKNIVGGLSKAVIEKDAPAAKAIWAELTNEEKEQVWSELRSLTAMRAAIKKLLSTVVVAAADLAPWALEALNRSSPDKLAEVWQSVQDAFAEHDMEVPADIETVYQDRKAELGG